MSYLSWPFLLEKKLSAIQKKSVFAESDNLFFEIGKRNIKNHFHINRFGENPSVGTSFLTIWDGGTLYSYPTTASIMYASSTSDNDISSGTGAQLLCISGLDENWNWAREYVYLNGKTGVATTTQFIRILDVIVLKAGSGGTAAGIIYVGTGTITEGVPANIYAKINLGNNHTQMGMMTIPNGYKGYIIYSTSSVGLGKEYHAALFIQRFQSNVWNKVADTILVQQAKDRFVICPTGFDAKTDLELRGKVDSTPTVICTATFEIILVKIDESVPDFDC